MPSNRRARSTLASCVVAAALLACDDRHKLPAPPPPGDIAPNAEGVVSALGLDSGVLDAVDPPAPAGDLAKEIESFVNIDTCVRGRANLDPLLGDALRAIGYDTFVRDACRLLEAAKDRKRETCEKIDASAVRAKCTTWIAILAGTPDACPLVFEGVPSRGRATTCVAVAGRDGRLCAAEPRTTLRATCQALTSRDDAKCDALVPAERPACKREVARWRALLPSPLEGLPLLAEPRGKLTLGGTGGTADPSTPEVDLASDVARGAVVVTTGERARVEIGALGESDSARIAGTPNKRPRVGVALTFAPARGGASSARGAEAETAKIERLELEVPGELPIVVPPGRCECNVTRARLDRSRGGEISVAVEGTITGAGKTYRIALEATTYVRDVVADDRLGREIAPSRAGR